MNILEYFYMGYPVGLNTHSRFCRAPMGIVWILHNSLISLPNDSFWGGRGRNPYGHTGNYFSLIVLGWVLWGSIYDPRGSYTFIVKSYILVTTLQ